MSFILLITVLWRVCVHSYDPALKYYQHPMSKSIWFLAKSVLSKRKQRLHAKHWIHCISSNCHFENRLPAAYYKCVHTHRHHATVYRYARIINFPLLHSQVTVWGDYGRIEGKKVFMGVAQIMLDNLNLSNIVIGWYKLFGTTSLVSGPPSLGLSRRSSIASLDSLNKL